MKNFVIIGGVICGLLVGRIGMMCMPVFAENFISDALPEIYIKAVNPGYKMDNKNNTGEMIEIARKDVSGKPFSLAGLSIGYTNSSGTTAILAEFPEHSWMVGENILLRLASSPDSELANIQYSKTLAMKAGPISIMRGDEIIDTVCWTSAEGCYKAFDSSKPTVLVRDEVNGDFKYVPVADYDVSYDEKNYFVETTDEEGYGVVASRCNGMKFSEILTYYAESKEEQFIELYNSGAEQVLLDGCKIKYKNKYYILNGIVKPEGYFVVYYKDFGFSLTKNPTNFNTLEIVDINDTIVDVLKYPNGQRRATAYAWLGYDSGGEELWKVTYAPTPGEANNYQEYKTCEVGKVLNEATGNCVKVTSVAEKICGEGKYLNVLTGRCKSVEETKEKVCKEGYYLNPETNRCNKIKENKGADYSVDTTDTYSEESSFVALYAMIGVGVVGFIYIVYEFRREIWRGAKKVFGGKKIDSTKTEIKRGAVFQRIRKAWQGFLEKLRRGTDHH